MMRKTFPAKAALVIANPKAKLLDQLKEVLRVKHYSLRTEEAYVQWVRRFLKFHRVKTSTPLPGRGGEGEWQWRHPRELGVAEVVAFLNHLANVESVAAATQNQALNALSFLYTQVLRLELGELGEVLAASKRRRVPVVLSKEEAYWAWVVRLVKYFGSKVNPRDMSGVQLGPPSPIRWARDRERSGN